MFGRREEASPFLFLVAGDKHMEGRDLVLKRSDDWEASCQRAPLLPRSRFDKLKALSVPKGFSGTIFAIAGICCAMVASLRLARCLLSVISIRYYASTCSAKVSNTSTMVLIVNTLAFSEFISIIFQLAGPAERVCSNS